MISPGLSRDRWLIRRDEGLELPLCKCPFHGKRILHQWAKKIAYVRHHFLHPQTRGSASWQLLGPCTQIYIPLCWKKSKTRTQGWEMDKPPFAGLGWCSSRNGMQYPELKGGADSFISNVLPGSWWVWWCRWVLQKGTPKDLQWVVEACCYRIQF